MWKYEGEYWRWGTLFYFIISLLFQKVRFGCCLCAGTCQAAITKYYGLGDLNNRNSFLIVLEAGNSKIQVQGNLILMKTLFLACKQQPTFCVLTWQRERENFLLLFLLLKVLVPFVSTPPSWPNYLPKAHLQVLSHWGLGLKQMNLLGGRQGRYSVQRGYPVFDVNNHIAVVNQLLSCVQCFVIPWTAAHQASLSFTISLSLLKLMSTELVMLSNHLILCHHFLLTFIFPSISLFWLVGSLHQVTKVLELQLQQLSFQWIFSVVFL